MNDQGEQFAWRETYFVLFPADDRPTLSQVEAAIGDANQRLKVENLMADDDGLFNSALVQAVEDNAAMEISYEMGEAVVEQNIELAQQLRDQIDETQLSLLLRADARLDVMHLERMPEAKEDEFDEYGDNEDDEMMAEALDPASLITVVETLARLTGGLAIDPAAGEIMV